MRPRLVLRFQHWVIAVNALLVLLLTTAFLALVFGKFQHLAETNAQHNFGLQTDKVFHQLHEELRAQRDFVELMATVDGALAGPGRDVDAEALLSMMVHSLRAQPSRYSVYFGLHDGGFVQVVAVRDDARIRGALQAPEGSTEAVRTIRRAADGRRIERWQFRDSAGSVLSQREGVAGYDPTTRPWYRGALAQRSTFLTEPYRFASNNALGVTFAAPLRDGRTVFGADISLQAFNAVVNQLTLSPNGAMLVLDRQYQVLAMQAPPAFYGETIDPTTQTMPLARHPGPYLAPLAASIAASGAPETQGQVELAGKTFVLATRRLEPLPGVPYHIVTLAPLSDFTGVVERSRRDVLLLAALMVLIIVPVALLSTRRVALSLAALARHSERLRQLDFSTRPAHIESFLSEVNALGHVQEVMHDSLAQRTVALEAATRKLTHLVQIGIRLGREQDHDTLLRDVVHGARNIAQCSVARLHLRTPQNTLRQALSNGLGDTRPPGAELALGTPPGPDDDLVVQAARHRRAIVANAFDDSTHRHGHLHDALEDALGVPVASALVVPLLASDGEVLGVLQLLNAADGAHDAGFDPAVVEFMEALCAQAAVAMENQHLLRSQRELMEAVVQVLASAIDTKSAYTGGHCARVPELAVMLAEQATAVCEGPLADFGFSSEDEWREFRVGAWLHDCGKIITPEYVVDKATKLETIHNRIHEIRTRFEVLRRDAEIEALRAIAGGQDEQAAWARFRDRAEQLQADFAFVAQANLGAEFIAADDVQRLRSIGAMTWLRHFDDRLGLAQDEARRHAATPPLPLPATEPLLADQPYHVVPREAASVALNDHGFEMKVPQHQYHHGELHNLSIGRGTLTEEERFKINEHIMHTIVMLERMPFPKNLQRVPEYAGTHHETLAGTGYPRRLDASQLSIPARIMAIADIFEALTASDRPYKKAKPLSEAIAILDRFRRDRHIDPVLFELLLSSGVYLRYAERFLQPDQIDEVDISVYLSPAAEPAVANDA